MDTHMTRLPDVPDLYTALRHSGVAPDDLPALIAACDADVQQRLLSVDQGLLRAILRKGQGGPAVANAPHVRAYLASLSPAPLFLPRIEKGTSIALLTNGEHPNMPPFSDGTFDAWFAAQGLPYGLGAYGEARTVYQTAQFADAASPERRTIHTGIDVFAPALTPVHAPLAGVVHMVTYQADALDYGNCLIVRHDAAGVAFYTLYGHLAGTLPGLLQPGDVVAPGQVVGHLGDWHENGGWAPHLHFQVMSSMLEQTDGNFFGVGHSSLWDVWQDICLDPNLVMRLPVARFLA
jgi:murein DD-endopeptidase MepM/ murein hydrolase activator NlpD